MLAPSATTQSGIDIHCRQRKHFPKQAIEFEQQQHTAIRSLPSLGLSDKLRWQRLASHRMCISTCTDTCTCTLVLVLVQTLISTADLVLNSINRWRLTMLPCSSGSVRQQVRGQLQCSSLCYSRNFGCSERAHHQLCAAPQQLSPPGCTCTAYKCTKQST